LNWETRLPGLSEWARVRDYRLTQISKLSNVEIFRESPMNAEDALAIGADHILVATGSHWRRDGRGRNSPVPLDIGTVLTPEDVMAGAAIKGPVIVYDEDHYYVASTIAEHLARQGMATTYVTDAGVVSSWSSYTAEQGRAHARLAEFGVKLVFNAVLKGKNLFADAFTGSTIPLEWGTLVPVTSRQPNDALWHALNHHPNVRRIGDVRAPGLIAQAVYDGHEAARAIAAEERDLQIARERAVV
jgi:dimethylamine/trimethylamine dehydrogenase